MYRQCNQEWVLVVEDFDEEVGGGLGGAVGGGMKGVVAADGARDTRDDGEDGRVRGRSEEEGMRGLEEDDGAYRVYAVVVMELGDGGRGKRAVVV